jgi:hypothetical protein
LNEQEADLEELTVRFIKAGRRRKRIREATRSRLLLLFDSWSRGGKEGEKKMRWIMDILLIFTLVLAREIDTCLF